MSPWSRPLIEPAELAARLGDPALRLIECSVVLTPLPDWSDFRAESGRALYEAGHLPGAVYADPIAELSDPRSPYRFTMPPPADAAAALGRLGLGPGAFAVLYCRGQNTMAARIWWMLRALGWDDAAVLNGGWARWTAEGRPVSRDIRAYPPATFPARPRPGLFVGKSEVRSALGDPGTVIVNALTPEQHEGRGGVTYGRPGRIPGSRCVAARALTDPVTHAYLPRDRLRAAFAEAGPLDRRVVTYCGAGVAASSDALVLTLLGVRDVAVYDGSLEEWARDPAMPMERSR